MTDARDDLLTPDDAAPIVGVPAFQLRAWSFDRVGPKNSGTRHRPMYREADLQDWLLIRAALEKRWASDG